MNRYLVWAKIFLFFWIAAVVLVYFQNFPFTPELFSFGWLAINGKLIFRSLLGLVFLGLFNIVTSGWGSFWRKLFFKNRENPILVLDIATGIIFISYLTYFLTASGLLVKFLTAILLVGGIILFFQNKIFFLIKNFFQKSRISFFYFLYLLFLLIPFLIALAPTTNYDSLVYHLALPEKYLSAGKIVSTPENIFATFPQNGENLYLFALSLGKDVFANLIHFNFLILSLILILVIAENYQLDRFVAGLIFISTPAFLLIAGHTFIDLALVFYVLLAFYCLERWSPAEEFWVYPFTCFLAFIPGIKYTGFIFWFILIIAFLAKLIEFRKVRVLPEYLGRIFGFALIFLLPYLVRNLIFYHNPLAPFFSSIFPTAIPEVVIKNYLNHVRGHGTVIKSFSDIIRLPVALTFSGTEFGGAYDIIGPLYLATFPGLFLLPKIVLKEKKSLLLLILGGFFCWLFTARVLRFLLPVVAIGAIGIALLLKYVFGKRLQKFFYVVIAPVVFHNLVLVCWVTGFIEPVKGYSDQQKYLVEKINNSYYGAAVWAKKNIHQGKILLFGDARSYYWHRPGLEIIAPTVFNSVDLTERLNKCNNIEEQINFIKSFADYVYLNYPEGKRLGVDTSWVIPAKSKKMVEVVYQDKNGEILKLIENEK